MNQKIVKGSMTLAKRIKSRRNELNLTIEEAAAKAGVGTKTWSRYEAGESIRQDKYKGVCRTLNWQALPLDDEDALPKFDLEKYRHDQFWPKDIEAKYGTRAALSFVTGSEIFLDYLNESLNELSKLPNGSHLGQISFCMLEDMFPPQFLMFYDYEFLYAVKCNVIRMREMARLNQEIIAHSVLDELTLYLISENSSLFMNSIDLDSIEDAEELEDWVFNLFDDMDIITFLYSNLYLEKDHPFYFDHWMDQQFYKNSGEEEV